MGIDLPAASHPGLDDSAGPDDSAEKLRDVQSIVDAALSRLDPQVLLDTLVERVKNVLQADTAAVLLLDRASGQLVATAASGLEDEVRQDVHIPIGRGFAGKIAAQGAPVIVNDVDQTNVINPILLAKGIRSLIGAPLLADGAVIGVLHVGTLTRREFASRDADLLQLAADRAAMAVQSLTAAVDRAAAAALQRSLVPSAFPPVDGLEMAGRYVPGSGSIGGDWYDVFVVPSGEAFAVIGDVAGTGLSAAVIMGRIRSALRAYALEATDPAEVLSRLNRKMLHFEPGAMATVLCAVVDRTRGEVRISSAGHLPPVLARPGEPAETVEVTADPPIGLSVPTGRRTTAIDLPPGAVLALYTDGLVERRDRVIDEGIARLRAATAAAEPEAACAAVMGAMSDYAPHTDDLALLVLRRLAGPPARGSGWAAAAPGSGTDPGAEVTWSGRHAVVTMPADIDLVTVPGVRDQLSAVISQSPEIVTIDTTATAFCDSAGIQAIAHAQERTAARGGELRLVVGTSPVRRILQLTGLDQVIPLYADVRQSLTTPRAWSDGPGGQPG
jgi:anti-anti-sigma factor